MSVQERIRAQGTTKSHFLCLLASLSPCLLVWLLAIVYLTYPGVAWSRPPHKRALADYFGPFLAKKLNDCQTCHLPDKPGVDPLVAGKPHNPFGARLKAAKSELKKLRKPTDIASRLDFVAEE